MFPVSPATAPRAFSHANRRAVEVTASATPEIGATTMSDCDCILSTVGYRSVDCLQAEAATSRGVAVADTCEHGLIAQARAGDELAIHRLLMLHHDHVAAILERRIPPDLRGVLAVEDVCQETYVAAVRELNNFEVRGAHSFFNWLVTIAERKLVDKIRRLRTGKRGGGRKAVDLPMPSDATSVVALLEQVAIDERTPSRSAASHELATAVQDALAGLDEDYGTSIR